MVGCGGAGGFGRSAIHGVHAVPSQ
jgi:hypothetical protein